MLSVADAIVKHNEIMHFRDEEEDVVVDAHNPNKRMDAMPSDGEVHTIKKILARPIRIKTATWADTLSSNTNVMKIDLFEFINVPNLTQKIFGFRYLKCDVEIRIQINAQPFQQGILLAYYIPPGGLGTENQYSSLTTLSGKTGAYSKVLDIADPNPLVMTFPFTNPLNYIDLMKPGKAPLGLMMLDVYAPLQVGSIHITAYSRLKNVSLHAPNTETWPSYVPQVGDNDWPSDYDEENRIMIDDELQPSRDQYRQDKHAARMAIINAVRNPEPETEAEQMNPTATTNVSGGISGFLRTVARGMAKASTVLGSAKIIMLPLSWLTRFLGGGLSSFGWSKPLSIEPQHMQRIKVSRAQQNYNSIDTSENLGLDSDNNIGQLSVFGTDLDEMVFDNILGNFNYFLATNWSATQPTDTILFQAPISPCMGDRLYSGPVVQSYTTTLAQTTYLGYIAHCFKYWRGDIRIQFRVAKTSFHSGRLRISWNPGRDAVAVPASQLHMAHSIIWDLKTSKETTVTIPYMSNMPWLPVGEWRDGTSSKSNGTITLSVLNPLIANPIAPQTVPIIMELAAAPGFQFSVPKAPEAWPVVSGNTAAIWSNAESGYMPQLGDDSGLSMQDTYITRNVNATDNMTPVISTIGEVVVSFRQLLKRFHPWPVVAQNAPLDIMNNVGSLKLIAPDIEIETHTPFNFMVGVPQGDIYPGVNYTSMQPCDLITYVAALYAYYRGSMRLKFFPRNTQVNMPSQGVVLIPSDSSALKPKYGNQFLSKSIAHVPVVNSLEGSMEVQVPYYSRVSHTLVKHSDGYVGYEELPPDIGRYNFLAGDVLRTLNYRAIGDDFSFGFLTGVPLVQIPTYVYQ